MKVDRCLFIYPVEVVECQPTDLLASIQYYIYLLIYLPTHLPIEGGWISIYISTYLLIYWRWVCTCIYLSIYVSVGSKLMQLYLPSTQYLPTY